jgi:hypothetical protein
LAAGWRSSLVGVYMVGFLGLIVLQNMQLEGLGDLTSGEKNGYSNAQ